MLVYVCRLLLVPLLLSGQARLASAADRSTARLATLCRVWGLLKYHHPRVASGAVNWDSVLVATLPRMRPAGSATD